MRIAIGLIIYIAACSQPSKQTTTPSSPLPPESAVYGRYIVLGAGPAGATVALARAIVAPDAACPRVRGPQPANMSERANPHGFAVKVCEALVPFETELALEVAGADGDAAATLSLPTVSKNAARILIVGDTGCKESDCAAGTPAQPFAELAANAAKQAPDVILHMGDFNYRGTGSKIQVTVDGNTTEQWSYDAGDGETEEENCGQAPTSGFFSQNAPGSSPRDNWDAWRDDFFSAAGELLWAAPWVLARGNHELCSRAGPGWFYFLDSSSDLVHPGSQRQCPTPNVTGNPIQSVVLTEPYRVDLGSLQLIVVDSANACDAFVTSAMSDFTSNYAQQLAAVGKLATENSGPAWLMTHRPMWGVESYAAGTTTGCSANNQLSCINQVMQASLETSLAGSLPENIELSIAGHMHHFQSLTFPSSPRPPQLIVGNGGVELSAYGPQGTFEATVQTLAAQGFAIGTSVTTSNGSLSGHGFLDVSYQPDGTWSGKIVSTSPDVVLATCGSAQAQAGAVCTLAEGVSIP